MSDGVRVTELWRYPVKSLLGERLSTLRVVDDGVDGEFRIAVTVESSRHGANRDCYLRRRVSMQVAACPSSLFPTVSCSWDLVRTRMQSSRHGCPNP